MKTLRRFWMILASASLLVLPAAALPAAEITIKIAHVTAQDHPTHKGLELFRSRLAELTGGKVAVDIYAGGVLGGDNEELQQIILGSLDGAVIQGIAVWETLDRRAGVEQLPFIFKNEEHAYKNLDGAFGEKLRTEIIEPNGCKLLNFWENGFRHFTNNKRPIAKPADMQGIKFRSAESEVRIQMFEALGSSAIPMPFPELFTALQQGTIDGQENPITIIWASKFYEVQKYLSLSGHIYSAGVFVMNPDTFNSYPADVQAAIQKAADEARDFERKLNSSECAALVNSIREAGMQVSEVDKAAFVAAVQPVWKNFIAKHGSDFVDAMVD